MLELQFDALDAGAPVVLVVEDDAGLRTLLMRTLKENGFRPLSAGSGPEMARCCRPAARLSPKTPLKRQRPD